MMQRAMAKATVAENLGHNPAQTRSSHRVRIGDPSSAEDQLDTAFDLFLD